MENKVNAQMTVGQIVALYPQTREILERLGIDYCCGGKHDLATAAAQKSLDLNSVLATLNEVIDTPQNVRAEQNWNEATLTALADHIEATHHAYMHRQLPRINLLMTKVKLAHSQIHGTMLVELEDVFLSLKDEIETHLMKEERILFPYIRQIEAFAQGTGPLPEVHCGTIANPINQMEHEHDSAGEALAHMRTLTGNYTLPPDACMTFKTLYEALAQMEQDLHQHIHLENSILFPKAKELELNAGICK